MAIHNCFMASKCRRLAVHILRNIDGTVCYVCVNLHAQTMPQLRYDLVDLSLAQQPRKQTIDGSIAITATN